MEWEGKECGQKERRKDAGTALLRKSVATDLARVSVDSGFLEMMRATANTALRWLRETLGDSARSHSVWGQRPHIQANFSENCFGFSAIMSQSSVNASISDQKRKLSRSDLREDGLKISIHERRKCECINYKLEFVARCRRRKKKKPWKGFEGSL